MLLRILVFAYLRLSIRFVIFMAMMEYAFPRFTCHFRLWVWLTAVCVQVRPTLKLPSPLPSTALSEVKYTRCSVEIYVEDWFVDFQRATFLPVEEIWKKKNFKYLLQKFIKIKIIWPWLLVYWSVDRFLFV